MFSNGWCVGGSAVFYCGFEVQVSIALSHCDENYFYFPYTTMFIQAHKMSPRVS
jgi:hypothetical protein